jgi:N-dimethylarginine dimethylaminohydrolase
VTAVTPRLFGGQSMVAPLRRVLVRRPDDASTSRWQEFGWRSEPDPLRLAAEHDALCAALAAAGADVVVAAAPLAGDPDAVYTFDPVLVCDDGAILLRPGKAQRRVEVAAAAADLEAAGDPVHAALEAPALAEGGDTLWLDERTLLVGVGYRTNRAGVEALRTALPGADVLAFDLPHWRGRGEVLHLLSLISPLDRDLALVHPPLMPTRLVELLEARGVELVEVAEAELESLGCNVLALAPRVVLAVEGNRETRRRLEAAGVEVRTFPGRDLCLKGDGGPTCLTRPLLRAG